MNWQSEDRITIAVVNVLNKKKKITMNKDLNGGFGTADSYTKRWPEKIIGMIKRKNIRLPIISLGFLMGILKQKNIAAKYYEGTLPEIEPEVALIYGSIVDYKNELAVAKELKKKFPKAKVGFIGPFASTKPELFEAAEFVIVGDFEYFFLKGFTAVSQLTGKVLVTEKIDLDQLPRPELEGFPISEYCYTPAITSKPFFSMQASKGCPYSCAYYCVYGDFQGPKIRARSPKNVVGDMRSLKEQHRIQGFQFRDPVFGLQPGYIEAFCKELKKQKLDVEWGIETRADLLDEQKIKLMFEVGLRNINLGIETIDPDVAKQNKRLLITEQHQEHIVRYSEKLGVKVCGFYVFALEGDTKETMELTLRYAKKLNTFLARFAVCTPYPGTRLFDDLKKEGRLLTEDYEQYTQFDPVIRHENFDSSDIVDMRAKAYRQYYFRPRYLAKLLKWKIRGFWL